MTVVSDSRATAPASVEQAGSLESELIAAPVESKRAPPRNGRRSEGHRVASPALASQLQVLSAEHWSLLTARSLTYNESFSRVGMFLTLLTGSIVGLALVAQVDQYQHAFHIAAILILSVVSFVGLATIGRLSELNREDMRCVIGMNRLRRYERLAETDKVA